MQRVQLFLWTFIFCGFVFGQNINPKKIQPDSTNYPNIFVKKFAENEHQSTFIIWIKKEVKPHYHAYHTEFVQVVSGKGIMTLNDSTFKIKKGTATLIPKRSVHTVTATSKKPLKVISVQAPTFDGDRIWVEEKKGVSF
ncbi:MAG: hypothetical protein RLZZ337_360 [Bacteroidota bacterium]|jgi:mannose-6-phosphate isomerase-like protein (cupin superfamily)